MSSSSSPCAACKLLRRKCTQGCVFAPYFPPDHPSRFANVHKVFGASNVSKLLNDLPQAQREDAVNSLSYEADARLRDPVYGCVAYISILQFKIKQVRDEIAAARKELASYIGPAAFSSSVPSPLHHPATAHYDSAAAQYAAGMGLGVGVAPPHAHQAQMAMPHPHHHLQMVEAQHMATSVEVAREQDMMMRQAYAQAAVPGGGAATVAVLPPGSADPAAYEGAPFLLQQQTPTSAQTAVTMSYHMEPSPPPQSSGQSHAQQQKQHTDCSDEGSGGAAPPA